MKYLIIILLLALNGCFSGPTKIDIRYPIIQTPPMPSLHVISGSDLAGLSDDVIRKLVENDNRLKDYIKKLEAAIDEYNKWAAEHSK